MDYAAVTRKFMISHKVVTFVADVIFVKKIPLLITMSQSINFVTVEQISNLTAK